MAVPILKASLFSIYPTPTLSSSVNPPAICSETPFSYTATSAIAGVVFSWSRPIIAGISNPANSGSGNTISETLTNLTSSTLVVPYSITLSVDGCTNTEIVNASIKPSPTVDPDRRRCILRR